MDLAEAKKTKEEKSRVNEICFFVNNNKKTIESIKKGKIEIDFFGKSINFKITAFDINGKLFSD